MKKVVDFLELHVQWLALGLGVAYVLFMAWTYAINRPVTVRIGNEELAPGSVDPYIVANAARELQGRMESRAAFNPTSPTWVASFRDSMSYRNAQVATNWLPAFRIDLTQQQTFTGTPIGTRLGDVFVEALPELPPAVMLEAQTGMSNVAIPQQLAAGNPAPGDPAQANVQPVMDQAQGKDIVWITHTYRIPSLELAAAFRKVKVQEEQSDTTILQVTLEREEQLPDGSWGKRTTIRPLANVQLMPLPDEKAPVQRKTQFLQWANTNAAAILQPPFYQVLAGDGWAPPGQVAEQVDQQQPQGTEQAFDPAKYLEATHAELMQLTNEQRQQVAALKAKLKKEEAERRAQERKGTRGGGGVGGPGVGGGGLGGAGGGGRGGGFGPNDGARGGFQDPGSTIAGEGLPPPPPPPGVVDDRDGQLPTAQPHEQREVNLGDYPAPDGEFAPSKWPEIIGWAHDDTVEAGKTYRYRVIYRIKSPVWNTLNITKPQELANAFALASDANATQWGSPVRVESLSHFWMVRASMRGDGAMVQVFRFSGGQLRTKTFDVMPGDAIGMKDGDVDFSTGWTLVDVASDPRTQERHAVLMDPSGRLHTRDIRADSADPRFKEMQQQATAASASAGGASDTVAGTR